MATKPLNAVVKSPLLLKIGDYKTELRSGCAIIDIKFPNVLKTEVAEIHFKNYYTAILSIKAKEKSSNTIDADSSWKMALKRQVLMPYPHCEDNSQDYFIIKQKQFLFEMNNTIGLRLILQQPSPVWKEFKLEDIKIYKTSIQPSGNVELPSWILKNLQLDSKDEENNKNSHTQLEGIASTDVISQQLQKLWALAEHAAIQQTSSSLGRYDIDGSYEINLLSYT